MGTFTHLHVHSEYSLLDGAIRVGDLVDRVKELGMEAVALTEHGVMYGTIEFYKAAKKAGIKPIVGVETYVAPQSRFEKKPGDGPKSHHLVLLAKNFEGYSNLCRLVSMASIEGFYYNPRIDKELLREHSKGLIGLSACLKGEVQWHLVRDNYKAAKAAALEYASIFEPGDFYFEVMDHNIADERKIHSLQKRLSDETGIKMVATCDCHYLKKEDYEAHDALLCIQTGKTFDDPKRMRYVPEQFHVRSASEMQELFSWCPEAVENTAEVADKCNLELKLGENILPEFPIPEGFTKESYLEHLCREGIKKRYGECTPEIEERLQQELDVINFKGFPGYFLIVWDFIEWAKRQGIPVGPGRGSAAGSLVAYATGITDLDPLKYNLIFERFLNPERESMPDIDTDFCQTRRGEVIKYTIEKYGADKVSQIVTFGRMKARAAIRDVGRVFDIPLPFVDKLAKAVPAGPKVKLKDALETPEFKEMYDNEAMAKKVIDMAMKIEGLARNASIHAAGVVISRVPITDVAPLYAMKGDEVVVQYDMNCAADIGLLKMDFLGLRNLTILDDAVKIIKKRHGIDIDLLDLPLEDQKAYEIFQQGKTTGIFQFESAGMRKYLKQLKPEVLEDLIAMNALYRPGPLGGGMVETFIRRKHGMEKIKYFHPVLETILKETYGVIVYQEQVMQIANIIGGYSLGDADLLRRAMGKKKKSIMDEHRERFLRQAKERGYEKDLTTKIFDLMAEFAAYGFNKSHSACYGFVAYQTAYLKAHYPPEYMAALLTSVMGNNEKVSQFVKECKIIDIPVLPPDVNESEEAFSVTDNGVRFGLAAVKNVGTGPVEAIMKAREKEGPFTDLHDFCCRVEGVNRKVMESLVLSGALDCFGDNRATLLQNLDLCMEFGSCQRREKSSGQMSLFGGVEDEAIAAPKLKIVPEMETKNLLSKEKELLGLYVSNHPLNRYRELLEHESLCPINDLPTLEKKSRVAIGGIITSVGKKVTKKNQLMAFVEIEDLTGSVDVTVFPRTFESCEPFIREDSIVLIEGNLELEEPFRKDDDEESEEELVPKVLASKIQTLTMANVPKNRKYKKSEEKKTEKRFRGIHIRLENNGSDVEKIATIIKNAPGQEPIFFHVQTEAEETLLKAGSRYCVKSFDSIKGGVEHLLGGGSIWLEH